MVVLEKFVPARWITAILGCFGFIIIYGLKVNLSVAIIAMVNHTAVAGNNSEENDDNLTDQCSSSSKLKESQRLMDGPFEWNENVQGGILAAYFYGYIFTQIPGGWIAEKFSAKHVFGAGTLVNIFCAIVTPLAAQASYGVLIALRILMGLAGGVTLPAMHVLIAHWAPPQERSKISSTIYAGMTLGTLLCMPLSGILASMIGWQSVFYVQGGLSILWYILWLFFVWDDPYKHPRITKEERLFICTALGKSSTDSGQRKDKLLVPWIKVLKSPAVWAIIVAHTCNNWGWYMLIVKLPTFMRHILHFEMKSNAGLSALPFLCMWIFTMLFANLVDYLRGAKIISTTVARKFATTIASVLPGIFLVLVTYVGCRTYLAVIFLTLGTTFMGGMYSGFLSNHIDIAPAFAGTLMGISNTFATVPGIIVPSFIGYMTNGNQTMEVWRTIFIITFVIFLLEAIFYLIFGSGEEQSWAKQNSPKDDQNTTLMTSPQDPQNPILMKKDYESI